RASHAVFCVEVTLGSFYSSWSLERPLSSGVDLPKAATFVRRPVAQWVRDGMDRSWLAPFLPNDQSLCVSRT
ncbi:hypothetical protein QIJ56_gp1, partial [ssRNA phage ESE029]